MLSGINDCKNSNQLFSVLIFCIEVSLFYFWISLVLDGVCWWLCASRCFWCATLPWNVWQCFTATVWFDNLFHFIFIYLFLLRNDNCIPHPLCHLSRLFSVCICSCAIHHFSIIAHAVRSNVGKWLDVLCVCVCIASYRLFIWKKLHIWMDCSLSASLSHHTCFSVFSCGLAPSFASLHICLISAALFPPLPPFFLYDVYLIGRAASLIWLVSCCIWLLAVWLVLLTSGDVMRSWLAVCNLCMMIDVFLHCLLLMNLPLNSPSFSLFFLLFFEGSNTMVMDFFFECICSEIFCWFFFVLCASGCIVCVQNCLTTHQDPCFQSLFSFKRSACIKYHRCSSRELTAVLEKLLQL